MQTLKAGQKVTLTLTAEALLPQGRTMEDFKEEMVRLNNKILKVNKNSILIEDRTVEQLVTKDNIEALQNMLNNTNDSNT